MVWMGSSLLGISHDLFDNTTTRASAASFLSNYLAFSNQLWSGQFDSMQDILLMKKKL